MPLPNDHGKHIHNVNEICAVVLKPMGPLCQDDADLFKQRMDDVLGKSLGRFVIDASAIPFVDSLGLEALVDVSEQLAKSGQSLKLCAPNDTLREVFDLTELTSRFETFEDVNSAVRSFL